eukprot:Lankesteria_metandrocarpae@DN2051_c0_g1_i1.p1
MGPPSGKKPPPPLPNNVPPSAPPSHTGKMTPKKAPGAPPSKRPPPPKKGGGSDAAAASGGGGPRSLKRRNSILGRKLHWEGFGEAKISGTIFQDLVGDDALSNQFSSMVDASALKNIFAKTGDNAASARAVRRRSTMTARDNELTILGNSRAQNIAIVLSRLKFSMQDLADMFMKLDCTLSLDLLETVAGILPTADELQAFKKFEESGKDKNEVRRIEKDYWPLTKLTRATQRVACVTAVAKLPEIESDLTRSCDVVEEAQRSVRQSRRFRAFLSAVLVWGNFVNHGGDEDDVPPPQEPENRTDSTIGRKLKRSGTVKVQMQTFGFTLGSLMKLYDFKTTVDPTISSLHFIIANMIESSPQSDLVNMADDFSTVTAASKISAKNLKEKIAGISTDCSFMKSEVDMPTAKAVYGDAYEKLVELYGKVNECRLKVEGRYEEVVQQVIDTGNYFGDKKIKRETYDEFFSTLLQFLGVYRQCVTDITKNPGKYKSILVESAQSRGLLYVKQEGGPASAPSSKAASKIPGKFSKPSAPMKKGASAKSVVAGKAAASATPQDNGAVDDHTVGDEIAAVEAEAALAAIKSGARMLRKPTLIPSAASGATGGGIPASKAVAGGTEGTAVKVSAEDALENRRAAFRRAGGRRSTVNVPSSVLARPPPPRLHKPKAAMANAPTAMANAPTAMANAPTAMANAPTAMANAPTAMANAPTAMANAPTAMANAPTAMANAPTAMANAPT